MRNLPIWQLHDYLTKSWKASNRLVVIAPTGSGKTTQVCQMLLEDGKVGEKQIIILQPRRVAARTVAARVAKERDAVLGHEVGYQIRFEDRVSDATRLRFMTEGVLLRLFAEDPQLNGIGAILFDEFHERNLLSDVGLALALRLQETTRPDLLLIVMSATLEAESVADYLGGCPLLESEGRSFPVSIHHLEKPDSRPASELASEKVCEILQSGQGGDILIFMPGMFEIQQTIREIQTLRNTEPLQLLPLHGELPPDQQDLAFTPSRQRKVIVATNVAETSITIEGIRFVIDSGLARIARYDSATGISTLKIEPISRASAQQRTGRAGRTAPGECYRLWTLAGHKDRPEQNTPEIRRTDLASMVLLLRSMGVNEIHSFKLLDAPDPNAVKDAEEMLELLGALERITRNVTPIGREMLRLPVHPRYARILLEAKKQGCVRAAALFAALTSGRDLLLRTRDRDIKEDRELFETNKKSDFFTLSNAFRFAQQKNFELSSCRKMGIHAQSARLIEQTFNQLLEICERSGFDMEKKSASDDAILRSVLAGFVDHLAVRQDSGSLQCSLVDGRTGTLVRESVVTDKFLVIADIRQIHGGDKDGLTLLSLATAVEISWLKEMFSEQLLEQEEAIYDSRHRRVECIQTLRYRDLLLDGKASNRADPIKVARALAAALVESPESLPYWNHDVRQWIGRVRFVARLMSELELTTYQEEDCIECLARAFHGLRLFKEAKEVPLLSAFKSQLNEDQQAWILLLAPEKVLLSESKSLKLLYSEEGIPSCCLKLQEAFTLLKHPTIGDGKVPVVIQLQTPDLKKLDVTDNLDSFRKMSYPKHRALLQKQYPSIAWP